MISPFILRDTVVAVKRILGLFWLQLCTDDWLAVYREILFVKNSHTAFEVKLYRGKQVAALIRDPSFRQLTLIIYRQSYLELIAMKTQKDLKNCKKSSYAHISSVPPIHMHAICHLKISLAKILHRSGAFTSSILLQKLLSISFVPML